MEPADIPDNLTPAIAARHLNDDIVASIRQMVVEGLNVPADSQRRFEAKVLLYRYACVFYVLWQNQESKPKLKVVRDELEKLAYPINNREGRRRLAELKSAALDLHDLIEDEGILTWGAKWLTSAGAIETNPTTIMAVEQFWKKFLADCQTEIFYLESRLT